MYTYRELVPVPEVKIERLDDLRLRSHYEIDRCIQWIRQSGAKRVCLQFSQDQLSSAPHIVHILEKELIKNVYILGDTSYGTCCIDEVTAQHVEADAIIHFGHSCLSPSERIPVLHIFDKIPIDRADLITSLNSVFLPSDYILLMYDVSCHHAMVNICCNLKEHFANLVIAGLITEDDTSSSTHTVFGRVINLPKGTTIEDYKIVFIGNDGPTAVNLKYLLSQQLFFIYNPYLGKMESYEINMSRFLRRRMYMIECLKSIKTLGILIGTLCVKNYLLLVERIKTLSKPRGVKCYIISVGQINIAKLANFPEIDAYVLISCAENALMDSREFLQPIVTPYEVELAFNSAYKWSEKYITDFTTLLPGSNNYIPENVCASDCESNVSLVLGGAKPINDQNLSEESSAVVVKGLDSMSLTESHSVGFLTSRSWFGLQQNLGASPVEKASKGRSGVPYKYSGENM